ncbi:MAG: APC family permease, partial [Bryobacteraceae bacterium]
FAGWAMILDYVLVPLLSAVYVSITAERLAPQIPYGVWAFLFAATITIVNLLGIHVTARASDVMMLVMSVSTVLFIALAARWLFGKSGVIVPEALYRHETFSLPPLMTAAAIATLSFLGFDAISTLAEDTRDPSRDIGFATVLVCLLQTVFCFLIAYLAGAVWPHTRAFPNIETAILDIGQMIGGRAMFGFTSAVLLVAAIASSITSQAGASRLLFGMGRDGSLPQHFRIPRPEEFDADTQHPGYGRGIVRRRAACHVPTDR